ncbi:MAG: hypothetical protein HQL02_11100 [Nitrospirae bacterium]|nr:hypothetical protein [Nitrospirota bacterium]
MDAEGNNQGHVGAGKFNTTTGHAKQRTFDTLLQAMTTINPKTGKPYELQIEGATNNLMVLKEEMANVMQDKTFLEAGRKMDYAPGQKLFSPAMLPGYVPVMHPNFKDWFYQGNITAANEDLAVMKNSGGVITPDVLKDTYAKHGVVVTPEGDVIQRLPMYAPKPIADMLNKVLGISKLKGIPIIDQITKFNAAVKSTILLTSLYHHQAFMREYMFSRGTGWNPLNVRSAYKEGLQSIQAMTPEIERLVRNGMTLGDNLEYKESLFDADSTLIDKTLDKFHFPQKWKDWLKTLKRDQEQFLFEKFGAGLKAKLGIMEYKRAIQEHPELPPDEVAGMVGRLMNDKFGGLNLQRMHRNPTMQHFFRLLALAPDWTESNIRLMFGALGRGTQAETDLYRHMWTGVIAKGLSGVIASNLILSMFDDKDAKERLQEAWKEGKLRWLDTDITPIYRAFGGSDMDVRKHFQLLGHYRDPIKAALTPTTFIQHKGSALFKMVFEALEGMDWKGQPFTTASELTGMDDKGVYMRTANGHKAGEPKGGELAGEFTKRGTPSGAITYEQIPSFAGEQIRGAIPIPLQELWAMSNGEREIFDGILKGAGVMESSTYPTAEKLERRYTEDYLQAMDDRDYVTMANIKAKVADYNRRHSAADEDEINLDKAIAKRQREEAAKQQYQQSTKYGG